MNVEHKQASAIFFIRFLQVRHLLQANMELSGDGYEGDLIGEYTPDVLVNEFVCSATLVIY